MTIDVTHLKHALEGACGMAMLGALITSSAGFGRFLFVAGCVAAFLAALL